MRHTNRVVRIRDLKKIDPVVKKRVNAVIASFQTIRRFFIRLIEITQKITVTAAIHTKWSRIAHESAGRVNIRIMATMWVRGRRARAMYWNAAGSKESGKNVPEKSIMGVMKRNEG